MIKIKLPEIKDRGFSVVKNSRIHGKGVFAAKEIPKGTRLYEYRGLKVRREDLPNDYVTGLTSMVYVMSLDDDFVIDAEREGNDARFINHSCDPNCEVYFLNNTPFIYTTRLIAKGEELSFDYRLGTTKHDDITLKQKQEWFPCHCGAANCRGTLMADANFINQSTQNEKE